MKRRLGSFVGPHPKWISLLVLQSLLAPLQVLGNAPGPTLATGVDRATVLHSGQRGDVWVQSNMGATYTDPSASRSQGTGPQAVSSPQRERIGNGPLITAVVCMGGLILLHIIVHRRRTHNQLLLSEARYRDFAEVGADWYWEMDANLCVTYLSENHAHLTGRPVHTCLGRTHRQIYGDVACDSDIHRHQEEDPHWLKPYEIEFRSSRADGRPIHIHHSAKPIFDENGKICGYRGIGRDITRAKRSEQALEEARERAQVTLRSIGEGVIRTDADGRVEFMNPVAEKLTGWPLPGAQGMSIESVFKVFREEDREVPQNPVTHSLRDGRQVKTNADWLLVSRNGAEYGIQCCACPINNSDGQVAGVVLVFSDVTDARRMAREMTYHATHDTLTGLLNRREFERNLEVILERARVETSEHALCYLDLDQFKVVNDSCGHVAGDELLRQVGILLQGTVRKGDIIARLGGDEFGVIMLDCRVHETVLAAENMRQTLEEFRFLWDEKSFQLGVSIGITAVTRASRSVTDLLKDADSACYAAKDLGRNRTHVYRSDDAGLARQYETVQWVARLNRAIEEDRFRLYCQAIAPAQAQGIGTHYELLLRLQEEGKDLILPGVFLPAAERFHLATKVDRAVIEMAFCWISESSPRVPELDLWFINLSGHSLGDEEFLEFVNRITDRYEVPPNRVCFEVTETAAISNLSSASRFMRVLRKRGFRFALDDFGSGLSSFGYLKNLPVDFLKIDGMFVRDILDDPIDFALVRSINEIGQVMGKRTIAESVENEAILGKLREIGVDYVQGYGVGRPFPLTNLEGLETTVSVG